MSVAGLAPARPKWVALAGLSALLAGGLLLLARVARLGFLSDFLSRTVLIGFLTGVGIQVAIGQVGGMLGFPQDLGRSPLQRRAPRARPDARAHRRGVVVDGARLRLRARRADRLLALHQDDSRRARGRGRDDRRELDLRLASHGVSIWARCPAGCPHRAAERASLHDAAQPAAAVSMFLVILAQSAATSRAYAVKYNERFTEYTDPGRPRPCQPHRRPQRHLCRQRQPHQDRDGRRGKKPYPGRAAHDRGHGRDRPPVPDQAAAVPAERGALLGRVPDRCQADRRPRDAGDLRPAPGRVLGRAGDGDRGRRRSASSRGSSWRSCCR